MWQFCVKYLKKEQLNYKIYLNIILENVIVQAVLQVVFRLQSKCVIALPTDADIVRIFKKTLIGGYSCVNTRMAFDTEIFLKDAENEKILFKDLNNELKRFSSKIIKMDENNQYRMAMTKLLPYGCIKRKKKF